METEQWGPALVREGEREAGAHGEARIYEEMQGPMRRYAARLVGPEDADDVVQDALLKFLAQTQQHATPGAASSRTRLPRTSADARWRLIAMVRDVAIDRRRRGRKESRMLALITGPSAAVRRWMSAHRRAEDTDIRRTIHQALHDIPAYAREPWLLARELEMDYAEIAEQLGIPAASARVYVARANRALARQLRRVGLTPAERRGSEGA